MCGMRKFGTVKLKAMNIIEQIKQKREQLLSEEYKNKLLDNIDCQLTYDDTALIEGAPHFADQVWRFPKERGYSCRAPYKFHAAISDWLRSLGFKTRRYYNKGGVEYGMEVWI